MGFEGYGSLRDLGLKHVIVMVRIWVCEPRVPGVRLVLPYVVFWVVFFFGKSFCSLLAFLGFG